LTRLRIVHTESSCGWGGQELRIISESQGLIERGHDVSLAAPPESRIFDEARSRGIPVHAVPIARKGVPGFAALRRLLAERRTDVVNTHSSSDTWMAALALSTLGGAPPLVRTRHISAPIPRNPVSRWLYRSATAHVVTTGERLREQVMREAGLAPARVSSIPTGVDLVRFAPGDRTDARERLHLPAESFIVGIVATLRRWKGHRYLVEAFAQALGSVPKSDPRPGWMLVMVGDGPGADNLRTQVEALGLQSQVRMPGNQDDVVPWLRAFDAFALPSYANEGVPQAIMQAMACGVPVVSTPVGAIGELVREGETGLVVPPQDAAALCRALVLLERDSKLRASLARNAREHVHAHFARGAMLDRMEAVFRSVARVEASR
jgi:glycosyltransferase involved in cell wall biosynthesis